MINIKCMVFGDLGDLTDIGGLWNCLALVASSSVVQGRRSMHVEKT